MLNKGQSLLLTHRENYEVPKGQEQTVHCKIAKLDASGHFLEGARIVRIGVKKFETGVKDNLENMGYSVEILYHPMGRYSNVVIKDKDVELAVKDNEIARLRAELEEVKATKGEGEDKKKAGRPSKKEE